MSMIAMVPGLSSSAIPPVCYLGCAHLFADVSTTAQPAVILLPNRATGRFEIVPARR